MTDMDRNNEEKREEAGTEEPTREQPDAEEPTREQPGAEEPTREQPTEEQPRPQPTPRRLLRSTDNRVIGGVCGGLGRYFDVDPVFFRIGAIVLTLIGGVGILLYLAALLLVPSDDGQPAPAAALSTEGRNRGLVIAGVVLLLLIAWPFLLGGGLIAAGLVLPLALLVATGVLVWWLVSGEGPSGDAGQIAGRAALGIGVLLLCGLLAILGAWVAATGGAVVVAGFVIAAGIAVVAGAFLKPVRWLILPAIALALSAGMVSAAGIELDGGIGERTYRPASVVDLRDRYEVGIGELIVDLRDVDLPAGDTPLGLDVGIGVARLIVPEDVCVATRADVGAGEVRAFTRGGEGVDVDFEDVADAEPDTSRLLVDADVGVGSIRIGTVDSDLGDYAADFDWGRHGDQWLGSNDACLNGSE